MKTIFTAPALTAALALAACGGPDLGGGGQQVAARVNGNDIYMQQIASALEQNDGSVSPHHGQETMRALDHLIDQELLVQKALSAKLDREPQVVDAIDAERRRILGLAYLNRTVPHAPQRTADELHKFFAENPALFERRRIYDTREIIATVPPEKSPSLKMHAAHATRFEDIGLWFRAQNLPFHESSSTRPAEQIPLEMLPRLAEMGVGEVSIAATGDQFSIVQIMHAQDAPLTETQAAPIIERMLGNRWRLELAMSELKRLRDSAHIEYLGPFAGKQPPKDAAATTRKLGIAERRPADGLSKSL